MCHKMSFAIVLLVSAAAIDPEPNPPKWPASVSVFSPSDSAADIAAVVNAAFATNGGHDPPNHGQFSASRFALLFKPGSYSVDVPVGFYTQVLGLGASPDDVVFTGAKGVYCEEGDYQYDVGSLDTFWRGAENFRTAATFPWPGMAKGGMLWSVSQAAPLRRVRVDGELQLYEYEPPAASAGYSSGGFMANSAVGGTVYAGSQQQWMTRNSAVGKWNGGVWNVVFVGCEGSLPPAHCGIHPAPPAPTPASHHDATTPHLDMFRNPGRTDLPRSTSGICSSRV